MKDYSQSGEQKYILKYFDGNLGTVLDIGANDGETFSMSRALTLMGWNAVLIEPSPAAFAKLCALYGLPADGALSEIKIGNATLVRAAITDKDGPIDFYDSGTHLKKGDVALLSTTIPGEMDRWKKSGEQFTKTTVRGIMIETLMQQTNHSHFDFISIDAEGMDVVILKSIDLTAVGCQLVCVEFNQNPHAAAEIAAHCSYHGMKKLASTYENLIYAK